MKRLIHEVSEHESPHPKKIKQWSAEDYLVEDTLKLILSKIDLKCQRPARLVCKHWLNIINLSEFNIGALRRDELPLVVSVLSRYDKKPISIRFKNLDNINPEDLNHLTLLNNIVEFSGYIPKHNEFLSALTDLRSLVTEQISTDIFTMLKNLTKLDCKELLGTLTVPVTQLRELQILESSALKVSVNNFPNLKRLKADFSGDCHLTGLEYLYLRDKYRCDSFPVTLTELKVHRANFTDLTRLTNLKTLPVHYLPESNVATYFPFLERWDAGNVRPDNIFWEQISQLSYLTSLTVSLTTMPVHEEILTFTRLLDLTCGFVGIVREIDMSIFSSLSKLTRLGISGHTIFNTNCKKCNSLTALENLQSLDLLYLVTESFTNSMTNLTHLRLILTDTIINKRNHCFTKLTNLVELNLAQSKARPTTVIDGFSALTHLTSLTVQSIDDDDWRQILKLTNLRSYSESSYLGSNKDRFADLTAIRHLTFLEVRDNSNSHAEHLTLLTSLQSLSSRGNLLGDANNVSGSLEPEELEELVCSKMPYCKVAMHTKYSIHLIQNRTIRFVNTNK